MYILSPLFAQAGSDSLLLQYANACGWFFGPLFVLISIVFVTLAIMNWLAISQNAIIPPDMFEQFTEKLQAKEYQEAYDIAKNSDSTLGRILAVGLVKMSDKAADSTAAAEQAMNIAAEEEVMRLEHRLHYLGTVASVSPMVGLLGTVWGMIDTFSVIAKTGGQASASELADGIAMALVTTQFGMMIAIPALVLFEIFKTRLAQFVFDMSCRIEDVQKQFRSNALKQP